MRRYTSPLSTAMAGSSAAAAPPPPPPHRPTEHARAAAVTVFARARARARTAPTGLPAAFTPPRALLEPIADSAAAAAALPDGTGRDGTGGAGGEAALQSAAAHRAAQLFRGSCAPLCCCGGTTGSGIFSKPPSGETHHLPQPWHALPERPPVFLGLVASLLFAVPLPNSVMRL